MRLFRCCSADSAEIKTYTVKNDKKKDFNKAIPLSFTQSAIKVMSAQINFAATFGEQAGSYGIANVPDVEITLTKGSEGLKLFNVTSNCSRYISHVVDVKSEVERQNITDFNYQGTYYLHINNTKAGAVLEQYELEIAVYLDPTDADSDDDGIMDGVETGLLVENDNYVLNFTDYYMYDNLTCDTSTETHDEFYLEIPSTGLVTDADLTITVESDEICTAGYGNFTLQLIKEEINNTLSDVVLINHFEEYWDDGTEQDPSLHYAATLHLLDYLNNGTISELYGSYYLKIMLMCNGTQDNFTLTDFYIITDTHAEPDGLSDEAWYTDPNNPDTDGDGWNDWKEIFVKHTNPCSPDTDGDSVWDPNDRDPLRDVIIEIKFEDGTYTNWWGPEDVKLQAVVSFTTDGEKLNMKDFIREDWNEWEWISDHGGMFGYDQSDYFSAKYDLDAVDEWKATHQEPQEYYFLTPKETTDEAENDLGGHRRADFNYKYYANIHDDKRIQDGDIKLHFELWHIDAWIIGGDTPDDCILEKSYTYEIGSHEDPNEEEETLEAKMHSTDDHENKLRIRIKTLTLEKANTIAVFAENTTFTGHYTEMERMNVIMVHLDGNENVAGTPFVNGANAIVIPTSLFTDTVLNGYIQNEQITSTPLYSSDEDEWEMISCDRDEGESADGSTSMVDFVFIRFDLSISQAMNLLNNFILTCCINETTNDTAVTLDYISTKEDGIEAVQMGLHADVLSHIPWVGEYENDEQGKHAPAGFGDWLEQKVGELIDTLRSVYLALKAAWEEFKKAVQEFIEQMIMAFLAYLAYLLWLLIRLALLLLIYVLLAIEVLTFASIFTAVGLAFTALSGVSGFACSYKVNWNVPYGKDTTVGKIEAELYGNRLAVEAAILWSYWAYFDLYIPYTDMDFDMDNSYDDPKEYDPEVDEPADPELHCGFTQIGNSSLFDFHTVYEHVWNQTPAFVNLTLISPTGTEYNYTMEISQNAIYADTELEQMFTVEWWEQQTAYNGDLYEFDEENQAFVPPNWFLGVRFNKTIDFENEFSPQERAGQWYYYFSCEASQYGNGVVMWPWWVDFYPGPYYQNLPTPYTPINYLQSSTVNPYLGEVDDVYTFEVIGLDIGENKEPNSVELNILWDNGTIGAFDMSLMRSNILKIGTGNYTKNITMRTYSLDLTFSEYINISAEYVIYYSFSSTFQDGNISILWDADGGWFKGPILYPNVQNTQSNEAPIIEDWFLEIIDGSTYGKDDDQAIGPISEDTILRFWLYVRDPDGNYADHKDYDNFEFEPKLQLINLNDPENPIDVRMKYTGISENYGPGPSNSNKFDEYYIDILGTGHSATYNNKSESNLKEIDFLSGAFTFTFMVEDNCSESAEEPNVNLKIWHVGSGDNFWNSLIYGAPDVNIVGFNLDLGVGNYIINLAYQMSYTAAGLIAMAGEKGETIARIMATGIAYYELFNDITAWLHYTFNNKDTGALLGLSCGLFLKTMFSFIALWLSSRLHSTHGGLSLKLAWLGILGGGMLGGGLWSFLWNLLMEGMYSNLGEEDETTTETQDTLSFAEIMQMGFAFLAQTVGLTAILAIGSGKVSGFKSFLGTSNESPIAGIIRSKTILSLFLSAMYFIAFLHNSGAFYVPELLFNPT